jgi:hypothetical protein
MAVELGQCIERVATIVFKLSYFLLPAFQLRPTRLVPRSVILARLVASIPFRPLEMFFDIL